MKYLFFLLISTLSISSCAATPSDQLTEKVLILSGQENVEGFEFFSDFLFNQDISSSDKKEMFIPVYKNPSDYPNDLVILAAGIFLVLKDFEKAASLYAYGCKEMGFEEKEIFDLFEAEAHLSKEEYEAFEEAKKNAFLTAFSSN